MYNQQHVAVLMLVLIPVVVSSIPLGLWSPRLQLDARKSISCVYTSLET